MTKQRKRRQTSRGLPLAVWMGGLAGLILVAAGLIVLTGRQGSHPDPGTFPYPNIPRLSPADAHQQQQDGTAVIIDVRDALSYRESHATGALSVPEEELPEHITELPADKTLILY
ncbi:MAG: hypothetical protein Kow0063_43470 [Anaerolineae bacterium]